MRDMPGVRTALDPGLLGMTGGPYCRCTFSQKHYDLLRWSGAGLAYPRSSYNPRPLHRHAPYVGSARPVLPIFSAGARLLAWFGKHLP